jgi:signal transduction histidine kinase
MQTVIPFDIIIQPPYWMTWWFRSLVGIAIITLLYALVRNYYSRKLERQRLVFEKQQAIEQERTRIATDMHDDLGSGLSRIKFLSQALGNKKTGDETLKMGLEKITDYSDEMTEKMGEIVWALNEKNDTLADLVAYTRTYAIEYLGNHQLNCEINTPLNLPGTFIAGEIRRNIFLAVKECLHNIIKHANATSVNFSIQLNGGIEIIIQDNGKGIEWNKQRSFSNGIQNIRKRMNDIHGRADFFIDRGTRVVLQAPLTL